MSAKPIVVLCLITILLNGFACSRGSKRSGLFQIQQKDKTGYIDKKGQVVIVPQFDVGHEFSEGLAAVSIGGKYGFVNPKGELVINPQFDGADIFSEGMALVWIGRKTGFVDQKGTLVINPQFDSAPGQAATSRGPAVVRA